MFDDVVSIELRAIAGLTYKLIDPVTPSTPRPASSPTGSTPSDLGTPYLRSFPYLGVPYDGYDHPAS